MGVFIPHILLLMRVYYSQNPGINLTANESGIYSDQGAVSSAKATRINRPSAPFLRPIDRGRVVIAWVSDRLSKIMSPFPSAAEYRRDNAEQLALWRIIRLRLNYGLFRFNKFLNVATDARRAGLSARWTTASDSSLGEFYAGCYKTRTSRDTASPSGAANLTTRS